MTNETTFTLHKTMTIKPHGKLLIVDDDPGIILVFNKLLQRLPFAFFTALSAKEALNILGREKIDILITDIQMPGLDGLQLIKRARDLQPDLQCMIITGNDDLTSAMEAQRLGAVSYFLKPLKFNEITLAIHRGMEKIRTVKEIRVNEEIYRQLFSSIAEAVLIVDAESEQIIDSNEAATTLYGYSRAEFLTLKQRDITTKAETMEESISQCLAGHTSQIVLQHHRRKDGSVFPVEISATSLIYEDRKVLCWITSDITKVKQAEQNRKAEQNDLEKRIDQRTADLIKVNQNLLEEVRKHNEAKKNLDKNRRLLDAIGWIQSQYIRDAAPTELFNELLNNLNRLSKSQHAFFGEVLHTAEQDSALKILAASDFAWDNELKVFLKNNPADGHIFNNLQGLFETILNTGRPIFVNSNAGHLPEDTEARLYNFLAVPIRTGRQITGLLLLANRPAGYSDNLLNYLDPFFKSCAGILEAFENDKRRREAEHGLQRNYGIQTTLNELLRLSLAEDSLETILNHTLEVILATPWLNFDSKSCIFVVEDEPEILVLKAHKNLDDQTRKSCDRVPFGKCLCGQAAANGTTQFSFCIDSHHEIRRKNLQPHGHYCVPIRSAEGIIGVLNVYLRDGHQRNQQEEQFLTAVVNTLSNIIIRKQAEKHLKTSEEKHRTLVTTSPYGIQLSDRNGRITFSNVAHHRILGYEDGELEGHLLWDFMPTRESKNSLKKIYQQIIREEPPPSVIVNKNIKKDGKQVDIQIHWDYMHDDQGRIDGVYSIITDITEQLLAEMALKKSEQNFRNLAHNSLAGIMIVQDEQIVYHNPEMARMISPLPIPFNLGRLSGIHLDDRPKVKVGYQRLLAGAVKTLHLEFRYYPQSKEASREMKWIYCCASRLDASPRNQRILFDMMDVTRSRELERMVTVQDKMSSLGRVAMGIAHEIRNPLSTINVYLNTLKHLLPEDIIQEDDVAGAHEVIKEMEQASKKIESVVRRVLDFSKPTSCSLKKSDINHCITQAINLSAVTLRKKGISLTTELNETLPKCFMDSQLTEQVLLNLLTNAAEALQDTKTSKEIKVKTFSKRYNEKEYVTTSVEDSGPGVPLESQDRVFDPFYTTKKTGTGIGLSICQRIINDQQGNLTVSQGELGGAQFNIEFPVEKRGREE